MTQADTRSTKDLFKAWRSGDAEAGQTMAQRFADWYYAIATSRLGEERGRGPCEQSCQHFGRGIVEVTESRALVSWAHDIIKVELSKTGDRVYDGDEACAYTGGKKPKALLVKARGALPSEIKLLELVYSGKGTPDAVKALADPLGGNPIGILKARYTVKRWLREKAGVPFEIVPESPILDRAPMPLYESGRMATPQEEVGFEEWMLTDIDLCKDIAEFAHFSIALRGGLPADAPAPAKREPAPPPAEKQPKAPVAEASGGGAGKVALGGMALVAVGLVGLLLIAAIVAVLVLFVF